MSRILPQGPASNGRLIEVFIPYHDICIFVMRKDISPIRNPPEEFKYLRRTPNENSRKFPPPDLKVSVNKWYIAFVPFLTWNSTRAMPAKLYYSEFQRQNLLTRDSTGRVCMKGFVCPLMLTLSSFHGLQQTWPKCGPPILLNILSYQASKMTKYAKNWLIKTSASQKL